MTTPEPGWDIRVLGRPVVLTVPDRLGDDPDALLALAAVALERHLAGAPTASRIIGQLAHSGVVALRTISTVFELRESRDGWLLVRSWGEPEPAELAAAAWIRAHRLARERSDAAAPTRPGELP
ncbi:hypothetical protein [Frankia sp. QA3]|uniref:hypothetical protein n=1 Tax=Frankia sp. QA3 TaxID=710111 RepID=UPI000269BC9C|nr:hypothetical protein [Frankia sp. QA3]EIV91329.1 hypothetical protein FraQA3DRAFT_0770 [Frankia sp. QA3]